MNPILVMIDQPIKKSMNKPEATGRMIQWAIELSQFDIEYYPRIAIKAQALAYFIAKFTVLDQDEASTKQKDGRSRLMVHQPGRILTGLRVGKALGAKNLLL